MNSPERRPRDLMLRVIIGSVLAVLMLGLFFVPSLHNLTNISWAFIGLFLATGATGQLVARRRPRLARMLSRISLFAIVLSVVYTVFLLLT